MGFLNRLYSFFKGNELEKTESKLSSRIIELNKDKRDLDLRIEKMRIYNPDLSWFVFPIKESTRTNIPVFTPLKRGKVKTMKDLFESRKREEAERIKRLKGEVEKCYENISLLLSSEDVEQAEHLLYAISSSLKELSDESLSERYDYFLSETKDVKEKIRLREIERREQERQKKLETQLQKEKELAENKRKVDEERLRREEEARQYNERLLKQEQAQTLEVERLRQVVTRKKDNAEEIINYLRIKGVRYFYHFTDENNLQSIKKYGGLYSWHYLKRNDIKIPNSGGDNLSKQLDMRYGLQDYVRLSFCNDHPMAYRLKQSGARLALLKIRIDVAGFRDTQFSDINATDGDHQHGGEYEDLRRVDIGATQLSYVSKTDPEFKPHQAECMVKTFLPIEYIENINNPQRMH